MKGKSVTLWGIYSVWHRHAKVYQSNWLFSCLPPISEPIIYLVAFGYGLTPLIGDVVYEGETISYLAFIAPGMMAVGVLFQSFFEGAFGSFIRLSFQKTWQALLTAPLSYTEVFLGDWFWAATKGIIAGLLTGVVAVIWGLYSGWNLLVSLPLIILGSLVFSACGLLTAGCVQKIDHINIPIFLFVVPMFTICGTYFPRETLPPLVGKIAGFLPLASLVDLLRWPLGLPEYWPLSLLWLISWMVLFSLLAWRKILPILLH
ncbi:MAG: ABC transporter permease [Desertifilum sp.]|nr:ABC transporter permease [Desertifilum sp.]